MKYESVGLWLNLLRWGWQPQVVVVLLTITTVFALGRTCNETFLRMPARRQREERWRSISFYTGIFTIAVALQSPIDTLSQYSYAWHMTQHMILMLVAPPLCIAGQPVLRLVTTMERFGINRTDQVLDLANRLLTRIGNPNVAIPLFVGVLWTSHVPVIYDFALTHDLFHEAEHLLFLAVGIAYWSTIVDIAPFHSGNSYPKRVVYICLGILACWALGVVLLFAVGPLYRPYLAMPGASLQGVIADQGLGSAIMWAPSMIPFDVFLTIYIQRWLSSMSVVEQVIDPNAQVFLQTDPISVSDPWTKINPPVTDATDGNRIGVVDGSGESYDR